MRMKTFAVATIALTALTGVAAAQGVVGGAAEGAHDGNRAAGPVGAIVGGAVGAADGGVAGLLGVDQRPRFHEFAVHEHHDSYAYDHRVDVGAVLPNDGVTYYAVPPEYDVPVYKYAIVNGQTVLVDPRTHRITQIVD
jgi:Protein of unknown function (DUF1236)